LKMKDGETEGMASLWNPPFWVRHSRRMALRVQLGGDHTLLGQCGGDFVQLSALHHFQQPFIILGPVLVLTQTGEERSGEERGGEERRGEERGGEERRKRHAVRNT